jgi:hypothetical protein
VTVLGVPIANRASFAKVSNCYVRLFQSGGVEDVYDLV